MADFETDYFVQTRREIDTEKLERNKLLHLAILVLGGAYTVLLNAAFSKTGYFIRMPAATVTVGLLFLAVPLLVFITAITKARLIRKYQIADRWEVLDTMLSRRPDLISLSYESSLERKVVAGLRGTRYVVEDKAVFTALSIFIYFPLIACLLYFLLYTKNLVPLTITLILCWMHFRISWRWLFKHPLLSEKTKHSSNKASESSSGPAPVAPSATPQG